MCEKNMVAKALQTINRGSNGHYIHQEMGSFPITYMGKKAVIMIDKRILSN